MKVRHRKRRYRGLPFLAVLVAVLVLAFDPRPTQELRGALFDQYQRWQPRPYVDQPVSIVDIDEASLARVGQWPWPRTRLADLLDRLAAAGAAVVAFDVMFAEPDRTSPRAMVKTWELDGPLRDTLLAQPDHDRVFADRIARGRVALGFAVDAGPARAAHAPLMPARFVTQGVDVTNRLYGFPGAVPILPLLARAAAGLGALSFVADGDGVVRRVPLALRVGDTPVPTLATEALRLAEGVDTLVLGAAAGDAGLRDIRIGRHLVPTTPQGEIWLHYAQPVAGRSVSAASVLDGTVPPGRLAGHIVLVGSSAQGLLDLRFGPFGPLPGVEVHAQALEQMLGASTLERPAWARGLEALMLVAAGLGIGFLALRARALLAAGACAALLLVLGAAGWLAFARFGLLLDVLTPAAGILWCFGMCSLAHHYRGEHDQRWLRQAFARYVSPNRVDYLLKHPDAMALGGRRRECSFIFTDLQGFTGLIEHMDPAQAVGLLNVYLDRMIAIAFRHEGTLDRIVGDAVMILFSAPLRQTDHKSRALACALEMDAFARSYAAELRARGIDFGVTRFGVHAGRVIVGNFGGSTIFDYRALGDPVNTCARLESANKHLGTRMCVSETIAEACPSVLLRPVGRVRLKGKTQALAVHEPVIADDGLSRAPLAAYAEAFARLRAGDAEAAAARFAALHAQWPDDPLVALHQRRLSAGVRDDLIVLDEK